MRKLEKNKSFHYIVTCAKGPWYPSHKDGLAGIQRLGAVHDEVAVAQVPGTDLDLRKGLGGGLGVGGKETVVIEEAFLSVFPQTFY